jgi:hypothetical protein
VTCGADPRLDREGDPKLGLSQKMGLIELSRSAFLNVCWRRNEMTIENQKNQNTLPWKTQGNAKKTMATHTVANIKFALVCFSPRVVSTLKRCIGLIEERRGVPALCFALDRCES